MNDFTELSRRDEVLLYICKFAMEHGGNAPSTIEIAKHFQIGQQTIYGHMRILVREGHLIKRDNKWLVTGAQWSPPKILADKLISYDGKWRKGTYQKSRKSLPVLGIQALYREQKGMCCWCGKALDGVFEVDHRIPLSKGGENTRDNLGLSCPKCNRDKADQMPDEYSKRVS